MRELKKGFTTGSCATATTKAALTHILEGHEISKINIITPNGTELLLDVVLNEICEEGNTKKASYYIKKYSGDDPDITNGTFILSQVRLIDIRDKSKDIASVKKSMEESYEKDERAFVWLNDKLVLVGGKGVGRITKKGLACDVGEPAINPIPRRTIKDTVETLVRDNAYDGIVEVMISVPAGEVLALSTFNSKVGIVGGISILGTTGIVEPMSEKALVDTIEVETRVVCSTGTDTVVITPGNYGKDYLKNETLISENIVIKCSNFVGEALTFVSKYNNIKKVIFSGHLGKLVKVAGGILNTHSKYGDGRMEIIWEHTKPFVLGDIMLCHTLKKNIMESVMVDEAIRHLREVNLDGKVLESLLKSIENVIKNKIFETREEVYEMEVGVIIFSNKYGLLIESE